MSYEVLSIRIKGRERKRKSKNIIFELAHFRNILIILIDKYYRIYNENILNESVLYGFLSKHYEGKYKEQFAKALNNIENNSDLKNLLEQLKLQKEKIDNSQFVQTTIRQVIRDFKGYFKSLKSYKQNPKKFKNTPRPPKVKKLKLLINFSAEANSNIFKLENNNLIIRLKKSKYLKVKLPKDFNYEVSSVRIKLIVDEIYVDIVYKMQKQEIVAKENYRAGIDLGLDELIAVVSDNPNMKSFIISGKEIKAYNQWFNKEKAKLQSQIDYLKNELKSDAYEDTKRLKKKLYELIVKAKKLSAKRKRWLDDNFHKISRKLVNLFYETGHSIIYIGKNLLGGKDGIDLGDRINQQIMSIPYRRLIYMIKYKAQKLGIDVIEVDESYTSKTSPFADIHTIQKTHNKNLCNGERDKNIFKDFVKNKIFHADLVGATNILRVGARLRDLSFYKNLKVLFTKLCNPVRCKLIDFIYKVSPKSLRIGSSRQELCFLQGGQG